MDFYLSPEWFFINQTNASHRLAELPGLARADYTPD
jgi:hypothetical protein